MPQGAQLPEALDVRVERLSGEHNMLAQHVSQSNLNLTNSLAAMSADVREMTKEIKGMAPHAADIARLTRILEKMDVANADRDTEQARQGKQIEFWRGGIAVIAVVGMVVAGGAVAWAKDQFSNINQSRLESRADIIDRIGKQERRIERLEGMN